MAVTLPQHDPARAQTKKKAKPEVILDRNTRNKKKCVTTVYGLDGFGIKLSDAAKLFAKKYAGGAAVTKTPTDKEQIDVQVCGLCNRACFSRVF